MSLAQHLYSADAVTLSSHFERKHAMSVSKKTLLGALVQTLIQELYNQILVNALLGIDYSSLQPQQAEFGK